MLRTTLRLLPDLPLFVLIAVATHLAMSFARTLMHYKLGHHPMGGMHAHQFPSRLTIPKIALFRIRTPATRQQYALLFHSYVPARTVPVHHLAIQILPCTGRRVRNLVSTRTSFSIGNIMWKAPGFGGLHGSGASRSCISCIIGTRTKTLP